MRHVVLHWLLCLTVALKAMGAEPIRDIPNSSWVRIYFESIDRIMSAADLKPLRTATHGPEHLEVRLWFGFGLGGLRGFIVCRDDGKWSGHEILEDAHRTKLETKSLSPRDRWEAAWSALVEKRLLDLPDFGALPPSNYWVHDGSSGVVEVYAGSKYRTYMYPNSPSYDNPECRDFEALVATFAHHFLGGDGKTRERKFLSSIEIRLLSAKLLTLEFPLEGKAFLDALPVRLLDRDLRADGTSGIGNVYFAEWPLTNRADPKGHYSLIGYLAKTSIFDQKGASTIRHAEVVFRDRALEQTLVLQPQDFPAGRAPAPK